MNFSFLSRAFSSPNQTSSTPSADLLAQIDYQISQLPKANTEEVRMVAQSLQLARNAFTEENNLEKSQHLFQRSVELTTLLSLIQGLGELSIWLTQALQNLPENDLDANQNLVLVIKRAQEWGVTLRSAYLNSKENQYHRAILQEMAMCYSIAYQLRETLNHLNTIQSANSPQLYAILNEAKAAFYLGIKQMSFTLPSASQKIFGEAQRKLKEANQILLQEQKLIIASNFYLIAQNLEDLKPELQRETGSAKTEFNQAFQNYLNYQFLEGDNTLSPALKELQNRIATLPLNEVHAFHLIRNQIVLAYFQENSKRFPQDILEKLTNLFERLRTSNTPAQYIALTSEFETLAFQTLQKDQEQGDDPDLLPTIAPDQTKNSVLIFIQKIRKVISETKIKSQQTQTLLESLQNGKNKKLNKALEKLDQALFQLSIDIKQTLNLKFLKAVYRSRRLMLNYILNTLDSVVERSNSALSLADLFEKQLIHLRRGPHHSFDLNDWRFSYYLQLERAELSMRPWMSRDLMRSLAMSAGAISLAALPLTGGSSGILAGTAHLILTEILTASATGLVSISALNLADRYRFDGWSGLANFDSFIDAMTILTFTPRPLASLAPREASSFQKLFYKTKNFTAHSQMAAGGLLWLVQIGASSYMLWDAEEISKNLANDGIHMNASEIRLKATFGLVLAYLSYSHNARYLEQGKKEALRINPTNGNKDFLKAMGRENSSWENFKESIQNYLPWKAYQSGLKRGKLWGATKAALYTGVDLLLLSEATLFSYSNPDFNYLNTIESQKPFPELKEGESAVTLIGFEPEDLLYLSAHSDYFNQIEINRYGNRFKKYDFHTVEHLLAVLHQHRLQYGPIRYLKIATHGMPGKIQTGDGSLFDASLLEQNKEKLKEFTRPLFAPDARIIFISCLVGANLDQQVETPVGLLEKTDGEKFVNAFADIFLVNGGRVDTSTRILLGMNLVFGSALSESTKNALRLEQLVARGQKSGAHKEILTSDFPNSIVPLFPYRVHPSTDNQSQAVPQPLLISLPTIANNPNALEVLEFNSTRLIEGLSKMPQAIWKYGIMLEGPWWQNRYRSIEVPAHP